MKVLGSYTGISATLFKTNKQPNVNTQKNIAEIKCAEKGAKIGYEIEFVHGRDVFVVLPTGYGKGPCFLCQPKTYMTS